MQNGIAVIEINHNDNNNISDRMFVFVDVDDFEGYFNRKMKLISDKKPNGKAAKS